MQGGDFTADNGTGGRSIYGSRFPGMLLYQQEGPDGGESLQCSIGKQAEQLLDVLAGLVRGLCR